VREYVTKDPKTLGTFLAGKLTTLPLLPGFHPPKITPTPEQFHNNVWET
ncbi:MAG: hypothetical protein HC888_07220, partial [Candidatus Competibacteraceae bacterium]|nr:hypothetical protein [Candidatus Competibacteraceae bacterium]